MDVDASSKAAAWGRGGEGWGGMGRDGEGRKGEGAEGRLHMVHQRRRFRVKRGKCPKSRD